MKAILLAVCAAFGLAGCVGYGFPGDVYSGGYPGGGYGDGYYGSGQSSYGYGGSGVVRCESNEGRTRECAIGGGYARLVHQLSDAPCVEGRTWGQGNGRVWVSQGCRAEFSSSGGYGSGYGNGYGQTVRCESQDGRNRRCSVSVRSDVRLVRQLSDTRCVEGQNWGWDRSGIWVSRGCRAEFEVR